ncbi:MAG TPA: hypothetical protein VLB04_08540 [Methanotrichaceae archaeon]|nr:hypothetical protein [Methanotrichaceae archaeon]
MAESSTSVQDLSAIDALTHIFNLGLSQKPQTALGAAAYYISYIKYFPTNFEKILKVVKGEIPRFSGSRLRLGRRQLLIDGVIAQILPLIDYEKPSFKKAFGRELLLPADPKTIWETYKNRLDKIYMCMPEPVSGLDAFFNNLLRTYNENFSPENMYEKLGQCMEERSIPVNYSAPWILCSLLSNAKEGSTVSMMMRGTRAFDAVHKGYYERILEKGANIDMLLGRRDQSQLNYIGYLKETYDKNFSVRYTPEENRGSSRIAVLDDLFAMDARKMLPQTKREPSYFGSLYYDKDCIADIKNNFDDMWAISHEISIKEMRDVKPSWWNPLKSRRPLRW